MTKGKISEGKLSRKDSFLVTILVSETTSFTGIISSLWMEATKRPRGSGKKETQGMIFKNSNNNDKIILDKKDIKSFEKEVTIFLNLSSRNCPFV